MTVTNLKRSSDSETKGQNSPITWFILQQVNALGERLEKLRDKAEKSKENNQALQKDVEDLKKKQGGSEYAAESLTEMRKDIKQLRKKVNGIDELKKQIKKLVTQSETQGTNTAANQNNIKHIRTEVNQVKSKTKAIQSTGNNNKGKISRLRSKLTGLEQSVKARQKIVDGKITSFQRQVNTAMDKGQSGTFGAHAYPQVKFPASRDIKFNPQFDATPSLVYGLYLYDTWKDTNPRLSTYIRGLTRNGFNLVITTFSNTVMWGAHISWMACPKTIL
ncbi:unnamed protein product [Mytilus coruscus]|uniref:H-type lectin domain-containing protein n=1 Tax=Mytilus coruscus TaxID=42192 RepID=A0A6J8CW94_MYTCO|nr:unnamed protein product [Mytilus coruscus]